MAPLRVPCEGSRDVYISPAERTNQFGPPMAEVGRTLSAATGAQPMSTDIGDKSAGQGGAGRRPIPTRSGERR